jgi:preprotein translocase subunit SecG
MNTDVLKIIEIVLAVLIILLVTIQTKSNSLNESISNVFTYSRNLRGFEKFVFYLTILLIVGFVINTTLLAKMS